MQDCDNLVSTQTVTAQSGKVLKPCPANTLSVTHRYSRNKWKAEIEEEKQQALKKLKQICREGKRSPRKDEYLKICQNIEKSYQQQDFTIAAKVALWEHSERNLNLLRTKGLVQLGDEQRRLALFKFIQSVQLDEFPELRLSGSDRVGINQWFELTNPELVAQYGSPFYTTTTEPVESDDCYPRKETPIETEQVIGINTEFWGAFVGGDHRLGHDLVFYMPESRFYFYDLVAGCYLSTSDEKVRLVASQALQRCAWGQESSLATMILERFRTKKLLDEIITKAKAVLAADRRFFDSRPRWKDTPIVPDVETKVVAFVKEQIEPAEGGILPLGDCLDQFESTTGLALGRKEATQKINVAIRELHDVGLRNDLTLPNGHGVAGWKGLRIRSSEPSGRSEELVSEQSAELSLAS